MILHIPGRFDQTYGRSQHPRSKAVGERKNYSYSTHVYKSFVMASIGYAENLFKVQPISKSFPLSRTFFFVEHWTNKVFSLLCTKDS